jgi:hypothetical protein
MQCTSHKLQIAADCFQTGDTTGNNESDQISNIECGGGACRLQPVAVRAGNFSQASTHIIQASFVEI